MTLEESIQAFVLALEDERDAQWKTGEVVAFARRMQHGNKKSTRAMMGKFAEAGKCTIACLAQRADVYEAFEVGLRDREHDWSWHRSVMHAAKRTGEDIPLILSKAQLGGWGTLELCQLGRKQNPEYVACPTCGRPFHPGR